MSVPTIKSYYIPLQIDSTNDKVFFSVAGGPSATILTGTITHALYPSIHTLMYQLCGVMSTTTVGGGDSYTYSINYSNNNKLTMTTSSGSFRFHTGSNSINQYIGHGTTAVANSFASSQTTQYAVPRLWTPGLSESEDSFNRTITQGNQLITLDGSHQSYNIATRVDRSITYEFMSPQATLASKVDSYQCVSFEDMMYAGRSSSGITIIDDRSLVGYGVPYTRYVVVEPLDELNASRMFTSPELYSFNFRLMELLT